MHPIQLTEHNFKSQHIRFRFAHFKTDIPFTLCTVIKQVNRQLDDSSDSLRSLDIAAIRQMSPNYRLAIGMMNVFSQASGYTDDKLPVTVKLGNSLRLFKNRLIMGFPQQFQTFGGVAGSLGNILLNDLPLDDWQTFGSRVDGMDASDVAEVIKSSIDPERVIWVIVGDWEVIGEELKALDLGEIEVVSGDQS